VLFAVVLGPTLTNGVYASAHVFVSLVKHVLVL